MKDSNTIHPSSKRDVLFRTDYSEIIPDAELVFSIFRFFGVFRFLLAIVPESRGTRSSAGVSETTLPESVRPLHAVPVPVEPELPIEAAGTIGALLRAAGGASSVGSAGIMSFE